MPIEVWFDGACYPNPGGRAGYGAAIYRGSVLLKEIAGHLPAGPGTSNNVAEYLALTAALEWLLAAGLGAEEIRPRAGGGLRRWST